MARVNVYLPDDVAQKAREAKLNISSLTQEAVLQALRRGEWNDWIKEVSSRPPVDVTHEQIMQALAEARDELWGDDRPFDT